MIQEISDDYNRAGHPVAFSSPGNLKREYANRYGTRPITETLQHIDAYTTHREYHKPRVTNPFYVYKKRQQVQMDLIDVSKLKDHNFGATFILVAIDSFTKFAWARQLTSKSAARSLYAIRGIIESMGADKPESIFFDRGTEFKNRLVRQYLQAQGIEMVHPNSEKKAAIVERFNKTLQGLMYRFMTAKQTESFSNFLPDLLHTYNNRKHRSLKWMTPHEAEQEENQARVLAAHNEHYAKIASKRKKPKYKVGERVLIKSLPSNRFHRGYHQSFRLEQFEIIEVKTNMPIPMYILQSLNQGDVISGAFYAEELQPVKGDVFKIQVLKERKYRGKKQLLVKWIGWDDSHNRWINEEDVVHDFRQNQTTQPNPVQLDPT
jgi:co-chaperonin GroES (HSP10)